MVRAASRVILLENNLAMVTHIVRPFCKFYAVNFAVDTYHPVNQTKERCIYHKMSSFRKTHGEWIHVKGPLMLSVVDGNDDKESVPALVEMSKLIWVMTQKLSQPMNICLTTNCQVVMKEKKMILWNRHNAVK